MVNIELTSVFECWIQLNKNISIKTNIEASPNISFD